MEPLTIIFAGLAVIVTIGIVVTLITQKKQTKEQK